MKDKIIYSPSKESEFPFLRHAHHILVNHLTNFSCLKIVESGKWYSNIIGPIYYIKYCTTNLDGREIMGTLEIPESDFYNTKQNKE